MEALALALVVVVVVEEEVAVVVGVEEVVEVLTWPVGEGLFLVLVML